MLKRDLPEFEGCRHILVSGFEGSGKTTFLSVLLTSFASGTRIAAVEGRPELVLPAGTKSRMALTDEGYGDHVSQIAHALAEDPDVLVVSDIFRANATAVAAAMDIENGPMVLGSIHAGSADMVIEVFRLRLADSGSARQVPSRIAILQLAKDMMTGSRRLVGTTRT